MKRILYVLCEGVATVVEAGTLLFVLWNIIDPPKPVRPLSPKELN